MIYLLKLSDSTTLFPLHFFYYPLIDEKFLGETAMPTKLIRFLVSTTFALSFVSAVSNAVLAETTAAKVYQVTVDGMT